MILYSRSISKTKFKGLLFIHSRDSALSSNIVDSVVDHFEWPEDFQQPEKYRIQMERRMQKSLPENKRNGLQVYFLFVNLKTRSWIAALPSFLKAGFADDKGRVLFLPVSGKKVLSGVFPIDLADAERVLAVFSHSKPSFSLPLNPLRTKIHRLAQLFDERRSAETLPYFDMPLKDVMAYDD